jgi:NAD+ kinase
VSNALARRVAFVASDAEAAQQALKELRREYGTVDPEEAEIVVPLGGDGFMLETLHRFFGKGIPINIGAAAETNLALPATAFGP